MTIPVPTLSTLGFIDDSSNKFDRLLSHAFVADHNQTLLYPGRITSMQRVFQKNGDKLDNLVTDMRNTLSEYFSKYYTSANVECKIVPNPENVESNAVSFEIVVTVVESNVQQIHGRLFSTLDSKLVNILKLINYG